MDSTSSWYTIKKLMAFGCKITKISYLCAMKTKIVTLYVFLLTCLVSSAQTPISDALVHEIITECVSKTGGFIYERPHQSVGEVLPARSYGLIA